MNTVLKGNQFEDKVFNILQDEVEKGTIPILLQCCKFQRKPKYYSKDREKPIEFDISIEVTPVGAENYQLLYIAECKNYGGKISIDNIEEFVEKVNQVSGKNVKAVFVFSGELQSGVHTYAKNKGVMLIHVSENNLTKILLHNKKNKAIINPDWTASIHNNNTNIDPNLTHIDQNKWDKIIEKVFLKSLGNRINSDEPTSSLSQIERLSKENIENFAQNILSKINPAILNGIANLAIEELSCFLKTEYDIMVYEDQTVYDLFKLDVKGYCDPLKREIYINREIIGTESHLFTLAHEFAHILLHADTSLKQSDYNSLEDSKFNPLTRKHNLENDKNWIEWQANQFASALLMPKDALKMRLILNQKLLGINRVGQLFLDDQECNKFDYIKITSELSSFFNVSKAMLKYRMDDLDLIRYSETNPTKWRSIMNPNNEPELVSDIIRRAILRYS